MGYFPRPGKYVIKEEEEKKRFDFGKHIHHHKPARSLFWTILLLAALIYLFISLRNMI